MRARRSPSPSASRFEPSPARCSGQAAARAVSRHAPRAPALCTWAPLVWVLTLSEKLRVGARSDTCLVVLHGEFDPGSGRTLAACLTHASGATNQGLPWGKAANG